MISVQSMPGIAELLEGVRLAQRGWAAEAIRVRVSVIRRLRRRMASGARELAETIPTEFPGALARTVADSLVSEVLPLLEACRFLEREAEATLRTRLVGAAGRPLWLGKVEAEVERTPWGAVLVLAPANYPLLLTGVQTLQALTAGNAVLWKPAPGTAAPASALRRLLIEAGLPAELLTVLEADVASAAEAIEAGVDHVVLTGSAETGRVVSRQLAETLTPATMELSGCDAVFVLPGADLEHAVRALVFGQRFNGSATCMAPRRVFLVGLAEARAAEFEERLKAALMELDPVLLPAGGETLLRELIADAREQGAEVELDGLADGEDDWAACSATLILRATPALKAMQTDIFAPVLSVMRVTDAEEALAAHAACPYGLTASVFGPEGAARVLARRMLVGNVLINDVIVPTADPRIPFGGRGASGYGVTRGAEGLLAMTTPRTIQVQRGRPRRAYEATGEGHAELFAGVVQMLHGRGLRARMAGLKRMLGAARRLRP